jgi:hypothetical protein
LSPEELIKTFLVLLINEELSADISLDSHKYFLKRLFHLKQQEQAFVIERAKLVKL